MEKLKALILAVVASITTIITKQTNIIPPVSNYITPTSVISTPVLFNEEEITTIKKISKEKSYKIVFLGDSMTDLLGDDFPYLQQKLLSNFPKTKFIILNYGIGATDISSGYDRLTKPQTRHESTLTPLLSTLPDIIVIESFAYNHWTITEKDMAKYKKTEEDLFTKINSKNIQLICGLTIAPNSNTITDGIPGISLKTADKKIKAATIKKYMEIFRQTCQEKNIPIADAFAPSTDTQGEGSIEYINQDDHLHPSEEGLKLYSKLVYKEIEKLIQN